MEVQCKCGCQYSETRKACPMCGVEHSPKPMEQVFSQAPALRIILHPAKGRSVQALQDFKKGDLVERCPVIFIENAEVEHIQKTILKDFIYPWTGFQFNAHSLLTTAGEPNDTRAVALGYGSIYNHSADPNAIWEPSYEDFIMDIRAAKDIKQGDLIEVSYLQTKTSAGWEPNLKAARMYARQQGWS